MPRSNTWWSWLALVGRLVVGGTFIVSGTLKLIMPIENFEAAIRGFHVAPEMLERPIAFLLPWMELFAGTFCLVGLFTRASAFLIAALLVMFMGLMLWAKAKGIDMQACGCFGNWDLAKTPETIVIRNAFLMLLTAPLLRKQWFRFSLEEYAMRR